MVFKVNISEKTGKTFHLDIDNEELIGKILKDKIAGTEISPELNAYEFQITGLSDKAGFTSMENVEGIGLKRILLTYGKGMKKRPKKEGKRKRSKNRPKGLKLRKTVRGNTISPEIVQINLKILKEGSKKLSEIFPDQNKKADVEKPLEAVSQ
ncbi:30S ribosomal protein S6e [Candidatus Pacearchaeota archaeon]|nr:30S ribosomal protein S6e [Candidatus Pacearchaeota archaeon]